MCISVCLYIYILNYDCPVTCAHLMHSNECVASRVCEIVGYVCGAMCLGTVGRLEIYTSHTYTHTIVPLAGHNFTN